MDSFSIKQTQTSEFAKRIEQICWNHRPKRIRMLQWIIRGSMLIIIPLIAILWYQELFCKKNSDLPMMILITIIWGIAGVMFASWKKRSMKTLSRSQRAVVNDEIEYQFSEWGIELANQNGRKQKIRKNQVKYCFREDGILGLIIKKEDSEEILGILSIDETRLMPEEQKWLNQYMTQYLPDCPKCEWEKAYKRFGRR